MNNESDREIEIFTAALHLPPGEREAFLERVCGDDTELWRKVRALIQAHGTLENFLEEPPSVSSEGETEL